MPVLNKIVPLFIRNSEATGDIFLRKWPMTTLSLIANTAKTGGNFLFLFYIPTLRQ